MQMTLLDYLNEYYEQLTKENKIAIFTQIAKAVDHCHKQGFMHRDLKLENILVNVDEKGQVTDLKVADFGFSCKAKMLNS